MSAQVNLVNASSARRLPSTRQFSRWVSAATADRPGSVVDLRIVDAQESESLNSRYRGKAKPTNVLAFNADFPRQAGIELLGDLVICADVVASEAAEQGKPVEAHWAHLVVHGCLHLLGYDHVDDEQARDMEARETELMQQLGYDAPYRDDYRVAAQ